MTITVQRISTIEHADWTSIQTTVGEETVDVKQDNLSIYIPRSEWKRFVREVNELIKLEKTP